ncbi:MAG: hypothetical protein WBA43_15630 [Elainellaceae cyanobacterium]|jgi:hypothetical protein|nr:hypothetical protein [Leptolyngbya sp. CCY15150]
MVIVKRYVAELGHSSVTIQHFDDDAIALVVKCNSWAIAAPWR